MMKKTMLTVPLATAFTALALLSSACSSSSTTKTCLTGSTKCGDTCVNLADDAQNCGACGTVCAPTFSCVASACTSATWEPLAGLNGETPGFTDFTPNGTATIYSVDASSMKSYSITGDAFTPLAAPPSSTDDYSGLAWAGDNLYNFSGSTVLAYSISGNSWTAVVDGTLPNAAGSSEASADDSGYVYAMSEDSSHNLLQLKISDGSVATFTGPSDIGQDEPRAAWDSLSKRLYLGDYDSGSPFYAFNPADGSFTALAGFPSTSGGFSDAFCSDRNGHIYTTGSDCNVSSEMWIYTAATDTWAEFPALPFAHGCNAYCTVANGYLYFGDGDNYNFARIKLF